MFQLVGFKVTEKILPTYKESNVLKNLVLLKQNKPFLQIMLSGILGSAKAMVASCSSYLILWYYANGNEADTLFYFAVIGGGYFIGSLVAMYFTPALLKNFSKKDLYLSLIHIYYYLLGLTGQNVIYNVIGVGLALYYTEEMCIRDSYLEIKPGERGRIEKLIRDGRLLIGPWYVPVSYTHLSDAC